MIQPVIHETSHPKMQRDPDRWAQHEKAVKESKRDFAHALEMFKEKHEKPIGAPAFPTGPVVRNGNVYPDLPTVRHDGMVEFEHREKNKRSIQEFAKRIEALLASRDV